MVQASESRTVLYDTTAVERVLDAMAVQLAAHLQGTERVALVGVRRRGAPLADWLQARLLKRLPHVQIDRLDLAIQRYADDLTLLYPQTQLTEQAEHAHMDLSGRTVVVVDDVLYFGFSLLKAVQYVLAKGAKRLHTAVLVDRRCAMLPIHADVCGLALQVAPGDIIECHVPPFEATLRIELVTGVRPVQS